MIFCDIEGIFYDKNDVHEHNLNKDDKDQIVHKVNTLEIHQNVSQAAKEMEDTKILAKLAEGDMVAREACYHKLCMTKYTNKYRTFCSKRNSTGKQVQHSLENIALSMTNNFIEEQLFGSCESEIAPFIKLSCVRKYYSTCLVNLNAEFTSVNSTRLKENLMRINTSLQSTTSGKEVLLSHKNDLSAALKYTREHSSQNEASLLSRAAQILRRGMSRKKQNFSGSFEENC